MPLFNVIVFMIKSKYILQAKLRCCQTIGHNQITDLIIDFTECMSLPVVTTRIFTAFFMESPQHSAN